MERLKKILNRIDNRGYKAYKDLQGETFHFPDFDLIFYYVQGDPFAGPSQIAVKIDQKRAQFPQATFQPFIRNIGLNDYLTRVIHQQIRKICRGNRGTGKSGLIAVDNPGQEVLERSSVRVTETMVEARFFIGLPARGRRVLGRQAEEMLIDEIPRLIQASLFFPSLQRNPLIEHIQVVEDQEIMRGQLKEKGLIAFIATGSILPRRSGVDQQPLPPREAVPFHSPSSLEVELETPHAGTIKGMGIPTGINLIVGGGYHGKSTLLRALERSIYNHIPGDGRERVVASPAALKIRAEDGRRVEKVNITPFINNLPYGQATGAFCSEEASGSTSQAANILEGLEAGAEVLLMDEDTSATNFMIRDMRMQKLVAKNKEPITPFIDKVGQLYTDRGVSTILVIGGSGDYFDVADTVIMMDEYRARDVSAEARAIASDYQTLRQKEGGEKFGDILQRKPQPQSLNPRKGKKVKIKSRGDEAIQFGRENINLHNVEQIVDPSQTRAIGDLIFYALQEKIIDGEKTIGQILSIIEERLQKEGVEIASPFKNQPQGNYARPRSLEIAAALNRLRTLQVKT